MKRYVKSLRVVAAFALLAAMAGLAGCGGGKTTAKGKVTFNGKPVVWGTISLIDSAGMPHQAFIGLDGTFSIDDVPSGTVKVGVSSPKPQEPRGGTPKGGEAKGGGGGKGGFEDPRDKAMKDAGITPETGQGRPLPPAGAWFEIPSKFQDPNSSGITATVKKGEDLKIDITG